LKIVKFEDYKYNKSDNENEAERIKNPDNMVDFLNYMKAEEDEYGILLERYVRDLTQNIKDDNELFQEYNSKIRDYLNVLSKAGKDKVAIKIIDIFIKTWESDIRKLAVAYEDRSRYMVADGKHQTAYRNIVKAREFYIKAYGKNDIRTIHARITAAHYIRSIATDDKANEMLKKIIDDCKEFFDSDSQEVPEIIRRIINAYGLFNREDDEVVRLKKLCYEKCCMIYGKEHRKSLEALLYISDFYSFGDSDKYLSKSLYVYEQCLANLGKKDPLTLRSKAQLARAYERNYEYKQALTMMNEIYETTFKIYGKSSDKALESLQSLAVCIKEAQSFPNNLINKKILYETLREEYDDELLVHEKENIDKMEANLGDYLLVKYQANNYKEMIEEALSSLKEDEARIYSWKGIIYNSLDEHDKAILNMEKCYEATVLEYGETNKRSIYILSQLGLFQQNADQWEKATESYKKGWLQANKVHGSDDNLTKLMYESYVLASRTRDLLK